MTTGPSPPPERTRVRRHPERAAYDRDTIHAILDEALICHVAYVVDGEPRLIPTIHVRVGDILYLHGSPAAGTMRAGAQDVAVEVTLLDGLVLARSVFAHSMNYRSVVVHGIAREVTDPEEKLAALNALVEHVVPGRSAEAREPNDEELRRTAVLAVAIEEASAKIRTGPPNDDEEDLSFPVWAGVLPLTLLPDDPEPAPDLAPGTDVPASVQDYRRPT